MSRTTERTRETAGVARMAEIAKAGARQGNTFAEAQPLAADILLLSSSVYTEETRSCATFLFLDGGGAAEQVTD